MIILALTVVMPSIVVLSSWCEPHTRRFARVHLTRKEVIIMNQSQYAMNEPIAIAVTGANGLVGRMLLQQLQKTKAKVIALVRSPAELPAERVICNWMSSPKAMQAMQKADVIVHLCRGLFVKNASACRAANVETTEVVVQALENGRAKRVIFISYVGAASNSPNLYLCTKGEAEQLLLESGKEAVVFRCPAILNTPDELGSLEENLKAAKDGRARILGNGRQGQRPAYRGDVVKAIATAITRGSPSVYELTGAEEMTADDSVRLVNCNANIAISHTPAWLARLLSSFIPNLSPTVVDVMLRDCTGNLERAIAEFGLQLTSLRSLWQSEPNLKTPTGASVQK
jgi:NADH dehydrogenase